MQYELSNHRLVILATSGDRSDLEATLCQLIAGGHAAPTLELVGLATRDKLLALGGWAIDGEDRKVRSLFRELAEQRVLARLGVERVHLRACLTAATARGRLTLTTLAEILGVTVTGERGLACSGDLGGTTFERDRVVARRSLDLDALPAGPAGSRVHLTTLDEARAILRLVRRAEGTELPGLLAQPHHEVALPSYVTGAYHRLEVLLDHAYVRTAGDLVFPVDDPRALQALLER